MDGLCGNDIIQENDDDLIKQDRRRTQEKSEMSQWTIEHFRFPFLTPRKHGVCCSYGLPNDLLSLGPINHLDEPSETRQGQ